MISRPKSRRKPAPVSSQTGAQTSSKDQLLCNLELQQTAFAQTIQKLERNRVQLETFRTGFSLLYDQSPVGYITIDKRGHIHDVNATMLQLLGYERRRLVHLPLNFLVHKDDLKKLLNHLANCNMTNSTKVVTDVRLRARNQKLIPVELASVPFVAMSEQKLFLTTVIDLTERFKQQRVLARTREFSEAIVQTMRHPLAVLDPDLRIVSVNRAFTEFFKRSSQFIEGRVFEVMLNLWWTGNQLRDELEKVLVRDQPLENYRLDVQPPDIGRRILLVNARRLYQKEEDSPQRILVLLEDVTELELAREALQKTNKELEQRVATRTEALRKSYEQMEAFCYTIAHDLRAPLRSMTGFSTLLLEQFSPQLGEQGADFSARIHDSAKRMDQLIQDLLSYGRLNTTNMEIQDVNMDETFRTILAHEDQEIKEKHATITKRGTLPRVRGHPVVLQAVLTNLISNAMKFVEPGTRPKINVSSEDRGPFARIWVEDNGIGIAPENRAKIFGVFQRLHSVERYPGTGIGLAIVHKGIERMGGRVGVDSERGKGSRFWIELKKQERAQK